jgi:hypothetical protein
LLTTSVYITSLPATTGPGDWAVLMVAATSVGADWPPDKKVAVSTGTGNAVLTIERSASGSTRPVTVDELLVLSGSGVGEVTVAVLVTVPVVEDFTVTWTSTLAVAPATKVPRSHVTVAAALVQGPPWDGVALTKVTLSGRGSVTVTDLASEGPWLTTDSV